MSASGAVPSLRFGYGTNGLVDHRLVDALAFLADCGYDGVALTLDHHHLDPFAPGLAARVAETGSLLSQLGLAVVVETGARFLLDSRHKHQPTLLSDGSIDRGRRLELLRLAVRVGADLGAEAVAFWSGTPPPGCPPDLAWSRLVEGCGALVDLATEAGVALGLEPEPGMLVGVIGDYERLRSDLGQPAAMGLTVDVGHLLCGETESPPECIRRTADRIVHVQIEDMRHGVHNHLDFGEGDVDFPPVFAALRSARYGGLISVELPRDSYRAHETVPNSLHFLRAAEAAAAAA